jgi:hypothetical protein
MSFAPRLLVVLVLCSLALLPATAGGTRAAPPGAGDQPVPAAATATFEVTYVDFPADARASFQRAVDIWARLVRSRVPIRVSATFAPLGPDVGGMAGPSSFETDFAGAPLARTFYPEALADALAGRRLNAGPDIVGRFSSDTPWHFGTDPLGPDELDFTTAVLHELGHGLGFLGAARVDGGSGSMGTPGYPVVFDRSTRTASGTALLSIRDPHELAAALQGGAVVFDSPAVRAAHGGRPAELYAPAVWDASSYSHLDERAFPASGPDSLMTRMLVRGQAVRDPGPVAVAVLRTLGW